MWWNPDQFDETHDLCGRQAKVCSLDSLCQSVPMRARAWGKSVLSQFANYCTSNGVKFEDLLNKSCLSPYAWSSDIANMVLWGKPVKSGWHGLLCFACTFISPFSARALVSVWDLVISTQQQPARYWHSSLDFCLLIPNSVSWTIAAHPDTQKGLCVSTLPIHHQKNCISFIIYIYN